MDSDVLQDFQKRCPEYILPDDPPDVKPDLKMLNVIDEGLYPRLSHSSNYADDSQRDPLAIKEEPTAGPSGPAAGPGLERVKLDVSEAEAEEAARRDDELGLVETGLSRTLRPVLRRCDEVLSRPDGVQVSAITAGQRRRLGRTYKAIPKGSELLVYNGDAYARELNINVQTFRRKAPPAPPSGATFSGGAMIRCVHCDYACLGQDHLDTHVKQRHGHIGRDGKHKCEWCEYSTDYLGYLRKHRLKHTGERPHPCGDCQMTFFTLSGLTSHRRLHSGQRPYSCDVCGKAFTQGSHLTIHKRVHDMKVRQCDQCGATFDKASHYIRHIVSHYDVKEHRCQVCSARLASRQALTRHMQTHTGERPHSCSFCAARFSRQSDLKNHVTRLHTHDYRYQCGRCGKGFIRWNELLNHANKC